MPNTLKSPARVGHNAAIYAAQMPSRRRFAAVPQFAAEVGQLNQTVVSAPFNRKLT
jgi:hypothetical protein